MNPIYTTAADIKDRRELRKELLCCVHDQTIDLSCVELLSTYPAREDDPLFFDMIYEANIVCYAPDFNWEGLNQAVLACLVAELKEKEKKE